MRFYKLLQLGAELDGRRGNVTLQHSTAIAIEDTEWFVRASLLVCG